MQLASCTVSGEVGTHSDHSCSASIKKEKVSAQNAMKLQKITEHKAVSLVSYSVII